MEMLLHQLAIADDFAEEHARHIEVQGNADDVDHMRGPAWLDKRRHGRAAQQGEDPSERDMPQLTVGEGAEEQSVDLHPIGVDEVFEHLGDLLDFLKVDGYGKLWQWLFR